MGLIDPHRANTTRVLDILSSSADPSPSSLTLFLLGSLESIPDMILVAAVTCGYDNFVVWDRKPAPPPKSHCSQADDFLIERI